MALDSQLPLSRRTIFKPVNEVGHVVSRISDKGKQQIEYYSSYEVAEIEVLSKALDTKPIIAVTRTKKSYYNGVIGLNTRPSSTILIIPDIPTATSLHIWCSNHEAELIQLRKSINSIDNLQQKFWYMSCSGCKKKTAEKYNIPISCSCTYKEVTAQPWFRVVAILYDSTGTISATLFGNKINKLSSCTLVEMMQFSEQGRTTQITESPGTYFPPEGL
ncbi:hypothetical protein MRB53_032835 [Persea americana]|uniref:Uncharacterized protein n=1 Tax=Persea americana TaxID=3435 RepID=A0ACC2KTH5_PERAE|nr:hypothetical protein MRB53_032835 [Persea americana]